MDKKKLRLGMNPSTAAHRLRMDLLFDFVIKAGHTCYRCKQPLTRDTFSVEHIEAWLNSESPKEKFFDLTNIAYSHQSCNYSAAQDSRRKYNSEEERKVGKYENTKKYRREGKRVYNPEERREHYLRTGN